MNGFLWVFPVKSQNNGQHIIWTQQNKSQHSLNLSSKHGNQWETTHFKIEESEKPIIVPTLAENSKGDMWVAWTELQGNQGHLRYRTKRSGHWDESQDLITQTHSDMAPATIIDAEGIPWMVWSGTDETDDDIYYSRWIKGKWQSPERINQNDELPDILPSIALNSENQITVYWLGFNGDRYVHYSTHWNGREWSPESWVEGPIPEPQQPLQSLPDFVPENSQGSLWESPLKTDRKFNKNKRTIR